jgi:hypothetical protein
MSRLSDFFSNTFAQAKSHEPGWIQRLPSMPGTPQSLQDAFIANRWSHPYGKEANSMDIFMGGTGHPASSDQPWARTVGRAVGSYFLGNWLNNLTGTKWAAPAVRGIAGMSSGGGLSGMLNQGQGQALPEYGMAPMGGIPPINTYRDPLGGDNMPGLMAMLMALQSQQQPQQQEHDNALISGGGLV